MKEQMKEKLKAFVGSLSLKEAEEFYDWLDGAPDAVDEMLALAGNRTLELQKKEWDAEANRTFR